jgi:AcrR family transcriptional regulator
MAKPRPYEQRRRAESAEQTRRRIVETVLELLHESPSEPVSVERIAAAAGVARSTIYAIFGSRAGLFEAVGAHIHGSEYQGLLEAVQHPDALEHLRGGIRAASQMLAANRDTYRVLYAMAQLDEETLGGEVRRWGEERAIGMGKVARHLDEEGLLREDLTRKQAVDVLWMLTSFESFDLLYTGRGLSLRKTIEVLTETAERAVCR